MLNQLLANEVSVAYSLIPKSNTAIKICIPKHVCLPQQLGPTSSRHSSLMLSKLDCFVPCVLITEIIWHLRHD